MKCPNCERPVRAFSTRCKVCHTKFIWWYVNLFVLVAFACLIIYLLLEALGPRSLR